MSISARAAMVFAKIQPTSAYVDAVVANAWMEASNVSLTAIDADNVSLDLAGISFGSGLTYLSNLKSKLSFSVALAGSGAAGTAPAWGVMERICGYAEIITATSNVKYIPAAGGFEMGSIAVFIGDTLHRLRSVRGTSKLEMSVDGFLMRTYELEGMYVDAIEGTSAQKTIRDGVKIKPRIDPLVCSATNTSFSMYGLSTCLKSMSLDTGNSVKTTNFIGPEACLETDILDRKSTGECELKTVPLSNKDWFATLKTGAIGKITATLGSIAGNKIGILCPRVQITKHAYGEVDGLRTDKLSLNLLPDLNEGDTITSELTLIVS